MAPKEDNLGPGRDAGWDEYRWEAFIRGQDDQAGQYLALLEYFGDEPDSHNVIARAMGWMHLLTNCRSAPDPQLCANCPPLKMMDCNFHNTSFGRSSGETLCGESTIMAESERQARWNVLYAQHEVHAEASVLIARLAEAHQQVGGAVRAEFNLLVRESLKCTGKVAASLNRYTEPDMLGLVVANLKIAFHSACVAMGQIPLCVRAEGVSAAVAGEINQRLLNIRGHLQELILDFRGQMPGLGK